jgi:hypothetical protein
MVSHLRENVSLNQDVNHSKLDRNSCFAMVDAVHNQKYPMDFCLHFLVCISIIKSTFMVYLVKNFETP